MENQRVAVESAKQSSLSFLRTPHLTAPDFLAHLVRRGFPPSRLVLAALAQAEASHGKAKGYGVGSYLTDHVLPVAAAVFDHYLDVLHRPPEDLAVAGALLHDVLEDDPAVRKEDLERMFGHEMADVVYRVSNLLPWQAYPGKNKQEKRQNRLKSYFDKILSGPFATKIIKCADREMNLRVLLTQPVGKRHLRYLQETPDYYLPMAAFHVPTYLPRLESLLHALAAKVKSERAKMA